MCWISSSFWLNWIDWISLNFHKNLIYKIHVEIIILLRMEKTFPLFFQGLQELFLVEEKIVSPLLT